MVLAGGRDVFAEFLLLGTIRLVAGKVHGVGADREFAYVICQGESAVGLHLCGVWDADG